MSDKLSLDDIFDDEVFKNLKSEKTKTEVKSEDDRIIDAFEEINIFIDKNEREPGMSSMTEYSLLASLKNFRQDEILKKILKPFDRHNLLGQVEIETPSLDDVFSDMESLDILDQEEDSIFNFKHTPKPQERAESDFVAQRKPMKEKDFLPYEEMFQKVHKDIKNGRRTLIAFKDVDKHLNPKQFYIAKGMLLYFEDADFERSSSALKETTSKRKDGRTKVVFENGTYSNMLYRSLSKLLYTQDGRMITNTDEQEEQELLTSGNAINEIETVSGWIYIAKSKSTNPEISQIKDLHKIGFSKNHPKERIKNAANEPTYLMAEVDLVGTYACKDINTQKLEDLIQRFFDEVRLVIDVEGEGTKRYNPREWFIVPRGIIDKAIELFDSGKIVNYRYDKTNQALIER